MLAQREQSSAELRRKLLKRALAQPADASDAPAAVEQVEQVLAWLIEHQYLSEARFAESRVHARVERFGNLRIRHELAQHGIEIEPAAAAELAATEAQRALAVWQRKYGTPPVDAREKARQMRFLASRGFSTAVIVQLMRNCGSAPQEGV